MILSALLALVQLYVWVKSDSAKRDHDEHHHDEHHHEEHDHGLSTPWQRGIAYVLLALPIIVGTLFFQQLVWIRRLLKQKGSIFQ